MQTNVSKNAAVASGEAFGETDDNIKNGMPVSQCCEIILKSITLNRQEVDIAPLAFRILPRMMFLSETLNSIIGSIAYK